MSGITYFQMPHRLEVMSLVQAVTEPFVQKSVHFPFLFDQIGNIHRAMGSRGELLYLDHARIVVNLQMQIRLEQ